MAARLHNMISTDKQETARRGVEVRRSVRVAFSRIVPVGMACSSLPSPPSLPTPPQPTTAPRSLAQQHRSQTAPPPLRVSIFPGGHVATLAFRTVYADATGPTPDIDSTQNADPTSDIDS